MDYDANNVFYNGYSYYSVVFFEAIDVMPYVSSSSILVDGACIEISEEEQENLEMFVSNLFENAHTLPAFGVVTNELYQQHILKGKFVSLKFDRTLELAGLPFDELVFEVNEEASGFNLMRGINGVFQGRCVYVDLMENTMKELATFIDKVVLEEDKSTLEEESLDASEIEYVEEE